MFWALRVHQTHIFSLFCPYDVHFSPWFLVFVFFQEQCERAGPLLGGERPGLSEAGYQPAPLSSLPAGTQHAWHDDEDAVRRQGPLRRDEKEWVRHTLWNPLTKNMFFFVLHVNTVHSFCFWSTRKKRIILLKNLIMFTRFRWNQRLIQRFFLKLDINSHRSFSKWHLCPGAIYLSSASFGLIYCYITMSAQVRTDVFYY